MAQALAQASRIAADKFADAAGEQRSRVNVIDTEQAQAMLKECVAVQIHVERWRAQTTLTLDDLSIHPTSDIEARAFASVLRLGARYLLPKRIIDAGQKIENKYRNALLDRQSAATQWGPVLNAKKYVEWRDAAVKIETEYVLFAAYVYEHWDELMAEVKQEYVQIGWFNWNQLVSMGKVKSGHGKEWVDGFVARMMAKAQTREYWIDKARMWHDDPTYITFQPPAAQEVYEAALAAAKNEMQRDVIMGARKNFEDQLFAFVAQVRGEITERVFNTTVDVLTVMDKEGGSLPRNSSKQLKHLIDAVDDLKFWDDPSLEEKINRVRGMLDVKATSRDYAELETVLRDLGTEARLLLNDLGRTSDRASKHVGIPDGTEDNYVSLHRQARKLDFTLDDDEPVAALRQARKFEVDES